MGPTDVEASKLANYFPSYKKPKSLFDPGAAPAKKKSATTPAFKNAKTSSVCVVVLKKFIPTVPRGVTRENLARQGRLLSLQLHRGMSNVEVRRKVANAFKCSPDVTLLDASGGNMLCKCNDQNVDGIRAVERKGALYFCEEFKVS